MLAPAVGLTLPSLEGVRSQYSLDTGSDVAPVLARRMIEAGVADPADWLRSGRAPTAFIERTVGRWVKNAGGDRVTDWFDAGVALTCPLTWFGQTEPDIGSVWLIMDTGFALRLPLLHTVNMLEELHPRLPATFYQRLVGAANWPVVRTYDWSDAQETSDWYFDDWYDGREDDDPDFVRPKPEDSWHPALFKKPLGRTALSEALTAAPQRVRRMIDLVTEAQKLVRGLRSAREQPLPDVKPSDESMIFEDMCIPLPGLLLCMEDGDDTHRVFDEEIEQAMNSGCEHEPQHAFQFNGDSLDSIRAARDRISAIVRVLALLSDVAALLPRQATNPRSLAEMLEDQAAGVGPARVSVLA